VASSITNIGKVPELRRRLLFTLVCLAVYRIGVFVTTPGVNRVEMKNVILTGGSGSFLGMFNMFSGGALEQMSLFALGIMPYVSASIILQLLTVVVPALDRLNKEGEQGRKKINQYTRYGCVILSVVQSFIIATWLVLAWKTAGYLGVDRVLLPSLGTPWHRGAIFGGAKAPQRSETSQKV
jgi:preprotein translocase subunit SecY